MIILKKLITAVIISIIAAMSFTGCSMVKDAADDAEQVITEAEDMASEAVSEIEDNNNGAVDDNDGIIDNDDKEKNDD